MLTTTTDLHLRAGAGANRPSLAILPAGLRVDQLDQLGAWIQVRTPDGLVGWCSSAYLRPDAAPVGALPLPDLYSPAAGLGSSLGRHARLPVTVPVDAWSALELLDVEHNARYRPADSKTYCNIYATDFAHACGYFLPRTWWLESAIDRFRAGDRVGVNRHTPVPVRLYLPLCVRHDYWHSFVAVLIVGQLVLSGRT